MKTKKEIKREYKDRKKTAGVFQIKNTVNNKVLLGSSLSIDGLLNRHKFMLSLGSHRNALLQQEWNEYGQDKFVFEVLETIQESDEPGLKLTDELSLLEEIWVEELQPFGERGYNTDANIRQV